MSDNLHVGGFCYDPRTNTYSNLDGSDVRSADEQLRRDMERMKDAGRRRWRDYENRVLDLILDPDPVGRIFRAAEETERRR